MIDTFPGMLRIRCVDAGGVTFAQYGGFHLAQGASVDLLDTNAPDSIRFSDFESALNACRDPGFEIAQRILAGVVEITDLERPEDP